MKLTLAWSTIVLLLLALLGSIYAVIRVSSEKNKAKGAEKTAIAQKEIAKAETLRVRKQNFAHMSTIEQMASRLAELSTPQEALSWHSQRATALSQLGKHEESIKEYDLVLRADPENVGAKYGRGTNITLSATLRKLSRTQNRI